MQNDSERAGIHDLLPALRLNANGWLGELVNGVHPGGHREAERKQHVTEDYEPGRDIGPTIPSIESRHREDREERREEKSQEHLIPRFGSALDLTSSDEDVLVPAP